MADDEPDAGDGDLPGGPPAGPPDPARARRRRLIGRIAGVAAVVVVVTAVAVPIAAHSLTTPDSLADVHGPVAAARIADPMAYGPTVRAVPGDCGVPAAVARRLTGPATKRQRPGRTDTTCTWVGARSRHYLSVTIHLAYDGGRPDPAGAIHSVDLAAAAAARADATRKAGPVTRMAGLGQQAVAWTLVKKRVGRPLRDRRRPGVYHGAAGTVVAFQVGNVAAEVGYGDVDRRRRGLDLWAHPVEPVTLRGALAAATSVSRAVGAPVHEAPRTRGPSRAPLVRDPPSACAAVPLATVRAAADDDELAQRPAGPATEPGAEPPGITRGRCAWDDGSGRRVDVDLLAASGTPPLGDGAATALRDYARAYRAARETPPGPAGAAVFTALRGPGEQAFASYTAGGSGGTGATVVLVRNVRIEARCADTGSYFPDAAMNCAYAIAAAIAKRITP